LPFFNSTAVNIFGGQESDASVAMLPVVPGKEATTEIPRLMLTPRLVVQ
jgi:hypothetical protein